MPLLFAVLAIVTVVAWSATILAAAGMPSSMMLEAVGSGGVAGLLLFLASWTAMMVAMMVPAAAPMVRAYVNLLVPGEGGRKWRAPETTVFLGSYILVWTAVGVAVALPWAYLTRLAAGGGVGTGMGGMHGVDAPSGPLITLAGAAFILAGVYQATPLKQACLVGCRSPMHLLMTAYRPGLRGALDLGLRHAGYCVGCCWALFVVLFAVGVMSVPWMAALALVIFVEKAAPKGDRLAVVIGVAFVAVGLLILGVTGVAQFLLSSG